MKFYAFIIHTAAEWSTHESAATQTPPAAPLSAAVVESFR